MNISIKKKQIATVDNQAVIQYTLQTPSGFSVSILNYGGIIWEINTADKNGAFTNVVVNHGEFDPENPGYLGAITGRVAGRIKNAVFTANNQHYQLTPNNNNNLLHGGVNALDKKIWAVSELTNGLELAYFSPSGECGFPGNVNLTVRYLINQDHQLTIEAQASSDCETPINLTNHSYFNLNGVLENGPQQVLQLASNYYGLIDNEVSFTNQLAAVDNTPFDFRTAKAVGQDLHANDTQIGYGNGYDHPFVLDKNAAVPIKLSDPLSGRFLEVMTTEPVVVIYSANHFTLPGSALCLETQRMPNAINLPQYRESVLCSPQKPYYSKTIWQFGVSK